MGGLIAFPHASMSSSMLNSALVTMHQKNMYGKLVFYMEACESGSMFENHLPPNMNIYVTTAANAGETETLETQYTFLKKATSRSHVMQYGTMNFTSDAIGGYIGDTANNNDTIARKTESAPSDVGVTVDSRDIPLHLAYYNYVRADKSDFLLRQERAAALIKEIRSRQKLDFLFHDLVMKVTRSSKMFFSDTKLPVGGC